MYGQTDGQAENNIARRLRAKIWPDRAILDTSMKFGTIEFRKHLLAGP